MPLVQIYFAEGSLDSEKKIDLGRKVTELVADETNIPKESFSVMFIDIPPEAWLSGGVTVKEIRSRRQAGR